MMETGKERCTELESSPSLSLYNSTWCAPLSTKIKVGAISGLVNAKLLRLSTKHLNVWCLGWGNVV